MHPSLTRVALVAAIAASFGFVAQACSSSDDHSVAAPPDAAFDASPRERGHDRVSQTGLYADIATKTLASDILAFTPEFALWSDGAVKKRWIRLPPGTTIDTTDPDHWTLPVGTQLFKEFSLDGKRLETRLVERVSATGSDKVDYWLGAFLWRDDESDADFVKDGASNVRGTAHDVPSALTCWTCHIGEPGHALGFSALQLSHAGPDLTLQGLRDRGLVPASVIDRPAPPAADPTTRSAIGWLHANCGHCHNRNGASWPDTDMVLRLSYGEDDAKSTKLYTTTVGVPGKSFINSGLKARIAPGAPDDSAIAYRIGSRDERVGMPPIATEIVDADGIAKVRAWIGSLPRDAGVD